MLCRAIQFENDAPVRFAPKPLLSHTLAIRRDGFSKSTIGRSWLTTVSIDDANTHVDEHHADIVHNSKTDAYTLVPKHDTYINGALVLKETELNHGDVIALGCIPRNECTFLFQTVEEEQEPRPMRETCRGEQLKSKPTLFVGVEESTSATMVDELTCYMCLEIVEKPCVLPCGHMGCEDCLFRTLDSTKDREAACGLCRRTFCFFHVNPCVGLRNIIETLKKRHV
jgi:hypothetical protein